VFRLDGLLSTWMKTVVLATLSFAISMTSPALVLTLVSLFASYQLRPDASATLSWSSTSWRCRRLSPRSASWWPPGSERCGGAWRRRGPSTLSASGVWSRLSRPLSSLPWARPSCFPSSVRRPGFATTLFHLVPGVAAMLPFLVWRLLDEERCLARRLPGYADYQKQVRYRLVPFVW
jgi:hypothetical protein